MKSEVLNMSGEVVSEAELAPELFEAVVRVTLLQQALVRQLANARQGNHKTKNRSEVRGGGRKPWRQKGTGRARQGTIRAPQWVGGGTVFGPTPRSYNQKMPKRMRRAAVRSALSSQAREGGIMLLDSLEMPGGKTRQMQQMLASLGVSEKRALLVYADKKEEVVRAAQNLPRVTTLQFAYLNVRDLLQSDVIVITLAALQGIENWLGEESL